MWLLHQVEALHHFTCNVTHQSTEKLFYKWPAWLLLRASARCHYVWKLLRHNRNRIEDCNKIEVGGSLWSVLFAWLVKHCRIIYIFIYYGKGSEYSFHMSDFRVSRRRVWKWTTFWKISVWTRWSRPTFHRWVLPPSLKNAAQYPRELPFFILKSS
jgi:hypothetical protein